MGRVARMGLRYTPAMKPMFHPDDLAAMDPLVLMKNLDHVRMTSRRLSYVLQQQVHLYTPEANRLREEIDTLRGGGAPDRGRDVAAGHPGLTPNPGHAMVTGRSSATRTTTATPRRAVSPPRRTAWGSSAMTAATVAARRVVSNRLNPIPSSPSSANPYPLNSRRVATTHISS